jgi:hypothetical protein
MFDTNSESGTPSAEDLAYARELMYPSKARNVAARKIQMKWRSHRAAKKNAAARVITKAWAQRGTRYVLYSGVASVPPPNMEALYQRPLAPNVTEIQVRSGPYILASHTREYGFKTYMRSITYDSLLYKGRTGDKAFSLQLNKSGKITFTGGYPTGTRSVTAAPFAMVRRIAGSSAVPVIKNCTIQFDSGLEVIKPDMTGMYTALSKLGTDVIAPLPEGRTQPYISFRVGDPSVRIFPNGQVQISKITKQTHVTQVVPGIRKIMKFLVTKNVMRPRQVTPKPSTRTHPQSRFNNQIAPNIGTRSTTCPLDKRPTPYSFGGVPIPGHYIGANPQGMPCCYKIPKKLGYLRPKIIRRFANLGIRIPTSTKHVFGIQLNNSHLPVNVSGHLSTSFTLKDEDLIIGTRQAARYPLQKLVDIARRLGIVYVTHKTSKGDVIASIKKEVLKQGLLTTTNIRTNNVRMGGTRNAKHFTKDELFKRARKVYGISLNTNKTLAGMVHNLKSRLESRRIERFEPIYREIVPENMRTTNTRAGALELFGDRSDAQIRAGLHQMVRYMRGETNQVPT